MTREEFALAIAVLEEGVGEQVSERTATVWFEVLQDMPQEALRRAVMRYLAECQYPDLPAVGRLRALAVESMSGVPESAQSAFARVRKAVSRFGYCDPGGAREVLGQTVWRAIEGVGGWQRFCDCPVSDRGTLMAQFRDALKSIVEREQRDRLLPESLL